MECKRTSRAFCQCRIVNQPINHYLFSGETHSIGFANRGSCNDSANRNATNQWNSEVQTKINTRVAQENQRKAEEKARLEAERKRQELINQEIQRQNAEKQRQLEQQQAINKQNAIRESELLRQNEEQNIRVASISKEAIEGTQDFATSQGEKLSLFASDAIGTTAQATNQAIETTAESANQSFNFANENLAQNLVFLALIGGSGFLIFKNKNKLPKIF